MPVSRIGRTSPPPETPSESASRQTARPRSSSPVSQPSRSSSRARWVSVAPYGAYGSDHDPERVQCRPFSVAMRGDFPSPRYWHMSCVPPGMWILASLTILAILLWPFAVVVCLVTDCMR